MAAEDDVNADDMDIDRTHFEDPALMEDPVATAAHSEIEAAWILPESPDGSTLRLRWLSNSCPSCLPCGMQAARSSQGQMAARARCCIATPHAARHTRHSGCKESCRTTPSPSPQSHIWLTG